MSSDRVDQLDWAGEVFYRRLLNKVDDHGLYDARVSILRANLYPLKVDRVREADVTRWMAMCQKAGLIVLYEAEGKPYLQALDTKWEKRGKPKYPLPNDSQPLTTVNKSTVFVGVFEGVGGSAGSAPKNGARHKQADESPIIVTLPLREGGEFQVRQSFIAELEPLYPAVDVPQTIREMKGWCLGNADRLKTKRGIRRFIVKWLHNEQGKHGS